MEPKNMLGAPPMTDRGSPQDVIDRISHLPETILINMLSFLSTEDMLKTSFLSKRWEYLWTNITDLDLDDATFTDKFMRSYLDPSWYDHHLILKNKKKFVEFVDRALLFVNGESLRKLRLCFQYDDDYMKYGYRIKQWIEFAITSKVAELDIDFAGIRCKRNLFQEEPRGLPSCSYMAKSLTVMKLNFCRFNASLFNNFGSLETLELNQVVLCQLSIYAIFTKCPKLRNLHLTRCRVPPNLVIYAPYSLLRSLILSCCFDQENYIRNFKINVPNLSTFKFGGMMGSEFCVGRLSNPVKAEIFVGQDFILEGHVECLIRLLKELFLARALVLYSWSVQVIPTTRDTRESLPTPFSNLKFLKLNIGMNKYELPGIACLLRSSPYLETLSIDLRHGTTIDWGNSAHVITDIFEFHEENYWDSVVSPVHCLFQHLNKVEINGYKGQRNELEFVKFLLHNSFVLREMKIKTAAVKISVEDLRSGFSFFKEQLNNAQKLLNLPRASPDAVISFMPGCSPDIAPPFPMNS